VANATTLGVLEEANKDWLRVLEPSCPGATLFLSFFETIHYFQVEEISTTFTLKVYVSGACHGMSLSRGRRLHSSRDIKTRDL
jgi:hypothetical protein